MEILVEHSWFYSNGVYVLLGLVVTLVLLSTLFQVKTALKEKQYFGFFSKSILSILLIFGIGLSVHKSFIKPDVTFEVKIEDHDVVNKEGYTVIDWVSSDIYVVKKNH